MRTALVFGLILALATPASGFLLVGEDSTGDGHHYVMDEADVGDTISASRTDILGLDVAEDAENVLIRLRIADPPSGTGGYMYHVSFQRGEALYWTCWAIQWIGNQVSEENLKGCSLFSEGTQVGPAVTGPTNLDSTGVFAESDQGIEVGEADDATYVLWPVSKAEIGGGLVGLSDFTADTWFRGGTTANVGSTSDTQYHWGASDVGPDEGTWSLPTLEVPEEPFLNLTAASEWSAPAGSAVEMPVTINSNVENITLSIEAPESWNATFEWTDAVMNGTGNATVRFMTPTMENRTFGFTIFAASESLAAELPISLFTTEAEAVLPDEDVDPEEPVLEAEVKDTPGAGAVVLLAALVGAAVVARRK